jgi:hypothetical protein
LRSTRRDGNERAAQASLQGIYSASKHAVKGCTDALRMELQHDGAPVAVTLIKPGPIDTPYTEHAGNYLSDRPTHAPPVYSPESVAEAVLYAATHSVRDLFVGGGARLMAGMRNVAPGMTDRMLERMMIPATHSGKPRRNREALHQAGAACACVATTKEWCATARTPERRCTRCCRRRLLPESD